MSSPRKQLTQQLNPESPDPVVREADADDPGMHLNLAYYQSAGYIYSHHMNDWTSPDRLMQARLMHRRVPVGLPDYPGDVAALILGAVVTTAGGQAC